MGKSVSPIQVRKYSEDGLIDEPDLLAVEEPLEIRLGYLLVVSKH